MIGPNPNLKMSSRAQIRNLFHIYFCSLSSSLTHEANEYKIRSSTSGDPPYAGSLSLTTETFKLLKTSSTDDMVLRCEPNLY